MRVARRKFLRRALLGGGAMVALPYLDCFLDDHGEAVAATKQPLPVRFGTFFWGCGLTKQLWVPQTEGPSYEILPHLEPLRSLRDKVSLFSGFKAITDGKPNHMHFTGSAAINSGVAPKQIGVYDAETIDVTVAKAFGPTSRFRSVSVAPGGDPRISLSSLGGRDMNTPQTTPLGLYDLLYGAGYQDPRGGDWKPDPRAVLKKSVLSSITDDRKAFEAQLGAGDRARLDQYFTSVREAEQTLDSELTRPVVSDACVMPARPGELPANFAIPVIQKNSEVMSNLLALAIACNQTRVISMFFSQQQSGLFAPGSSMPFHQSTHEEPDDEALGYQPNSAMFGTESLAAFATLLKALDRVKEGDRTLLDRSLLLAYTDVSLAKVHAVDGIPMLVAGGANGRFKGGIHVAGGGGPVTRVGLTVQRALGIDAPSWGVDGLATTKAISEVLV